MITYPNEEEHMEEEMYCDYEVSTDNDMLLSDMVNIEHQKLDAKSPTYRNGMLNRMKTHFQSMIHLSI